MAVAIKDMRLRIPEEMFNTKGRLEASEVAKA